MISDLKKYVFIGVKEDLDRFFFRAQEKGLIEFAPEDRSKLLQVPKHIEETLAAIKIIKHYPTDRQSFPENSQVHSIVDEINLLHKKIETLQEERLHIGEEIAKIRPLGEFDIEDIERIQHCSSRNVVFFSCKRGHKDRPNFPEDLTYITSDHDLDYFLYFGETYPEYSNLNELHFKHSLSEWLEKDAHWAENIKRSVERLKALAEHMHYLQDNLALQLNHTHLVNAKGSVDEQLRGHLFTINGWVPAKRLSEVVELCADICIHFEEVAVDKDERVPTYMENQKLGEVGQDIVNIYDVPAPEDKDPSRWVLIAFSVFFAMIVSDAGYGFLYFLLAIYLRFKVYPKAKEVGRRFIKLVMLLSITTMTWGVLTCSYFSVDLKPNNPVSKYSLINYLSEKKAEYHMRVKDDVYESWVGRYPELEEARTGRQFITSAVEENEGKIEYPILKTFNDNILLEFALLVGVIHIILSFARNLRKCLPGIGWIAFLVGGYLYFPIEIEATSILHFMGVISKHAADVIGFQLLVGGLFGAALIALIKSRLGGLSEIFNAIQIFGDVLSYLRLYALGLAGMILAATINQIGSEINWVLGALVTIFGHSINIVLGIQGGVIHGLRLNFLEWYHYSFEGGGRLFNPLKRLKTYHQ